MQEDTTVVTSSAATEVQTPPEPEASSPPSKKRERGQSLIEYTILLTWTCLAMIAIIHGAGQATKGAWSAANNDLVRANAGAH